MGLLQIGYLHSISFIALQDLTLALSCSVSHNIKMVDIPQGKVPFRSERL
jgi:hypothetical protein